MCVRLPLVVPATEPLAVVFRTLSSTEVHAAEGALLMVAKLQGASGALAELPSMGWAAMWSSVRNPVSQELPGRQGADDANVHRADSEEKHISK